MNEPSYKELFENSLVLEGTNRNSSIHASGIVIGKTKLIDWVPMYKDSRTPIMATQYTMDIIEACGLVKMDILGLKTLTLIKHTERLIHKRKGFENFDANIVDENDEKTFDLFCDGKTAAIFQFESPGMQKVLKQAQPRRIEDIVALNALYRPGPMQFIDDFVAGKNDPTKIHYPDASLKDILEETYGVIVYQEQVMQVAQKIAGYSLGQADNLRRAMGKKKPEVMAAEKENFVKGAVQSGFDAKKAEEIFEILIPFAGYGFNKSHAAAYSVLAYRTAYLKTHFPLEFIAANLTNEMSSTDKLPEYIAEAKSMGLEVKVPNINSSDKVFDVVDGAIQFGLLGIKGLGEIAADELIQERQKNGPYKSFMDFLERVNLSAINKRALEVLIKTGCFDTLGERRSKLLLNLEQAVDYVSKKKEATEFGQVSLFEDSGEKEFLDFVYEETEDWPELEKLRLEKELIGFYISGHPLEMHKKIIDSLVSLRTNAIEHLSKERNYAILALVKEVRPILTKKQQWMGLGQLEDLHGTIKFTAFPKTWEQIKDLMEVDAILFFKGKYDDSYGGPTLLIDEVVLPERLESYVTKAVHIKLKDKTKDQTKLMAFRDFIYSHPGNCEVYFHLETMRGDYEIKAPQSTSISCDDDFITELKNQDLVESIWKE
jgi:DNA polymerase-3 subunit alpha